jgi:protein TonB
MDSNKILSANILDLIFDNRNKEYGAYELRNTYSHRITKALIITSVMLLIFISITFLPTSTENSTLVRISDGYKITDVRTAPGPEIPDPPKKSEVIPVKTVQLTTPPVIVDKLVLDNPIATVEDLNTADVGNENRDGQNYTGTVGEKTNGDNNTTVEPIKKETEGPVVIELQKEAKFSGNWENFLRRNLNANVPADNGAPAGNHTIIIQFVVDIDGNVSDIKPITNLGYGMEREAVRVLKKATKWEPAIQNGHPVKAFRRQPITFQVLADE